MPPRPGRWRLALRKFLYTIVVLIVLFMAGLFALNRFGEELTEVALVPRTPFVEQEALEPNAYQDPAMWFSRPGMGAVNDPARWQPAFAEMPSAEGGAEEEAEEPADPPRFAVFFVHPTSFIDRNAWNAPLDEEVSQTRARLMVRGLGSAFNQASEIWAPRYRQATIGSFITDVPDAGMAIDAAYRDVGQAFDVFLESIPADMPIVLAGHAQGAYLVTRILQDRASDQAFMDRIAMAYPIGWPISIEHDLPGLGLPACTGPGEGGCIVSWASFAEPADPSQFLRRYTAIPGNDGEPRGASPILCTNPLTGTPGGEAPASLNRGTLLPNEDLSSGELIAGAIPARCNESGLLLIGNPPAMGPGVLPGNNYHVYDIPLFWKNLQADVVERVRAWQQNRS